MSVRKVSPIRLGASRMASLPDARRHLGYDNAHGVKPPKKFKFAGQRFTYDHRHRHASDKGVPYEFTDAHQLLSDFFTEADEVLEDAKRR